MKQPSDSFPKQTLARTKERRGMEDLAKTLARPATAVLPVLGTIILQSFPPEDCEFGRWLVIFGRDLLNALPGEPNDNPPHANRAALRQGALLYEVNGAHFLKD